jgi:hypothetical protein
VPAAFDESFLRVEREVTGEMEGAGRDLTKSLHGRMLD